MDSAEKLEKWGPGPWVNEPDRVDFKAFGFPCLLRRNEGMGNWCGYVAVPPGHPLHGADLDAAQGKPLQVHWGLTYADACSGEICHVPAPGEPDDVWWLGFDCGHCNDLQPGLQRLMPGKLITEMLNQEYKNVEYVERETIGLAAQIAALYPEHAPKATARSQRS